MSAVQWGQDTICRHRNVAATCRECNPYAVARNSDPRTSKNAAASIPSERISEGQRLILALLKEKPMTDDAIYIQVLYEAVGKHHPMSPSGARTRRSELVAQGLVVDSGKTEKTASGRESIVWAAR